MPTEKQQLGRKGEEMAADFLSKKGYEVIEKNFYKRMGEIDLIAYDPEWNEIVFVEVKTRRSKTFGYPEEAVTERKMQKMAKAAESWLLKNKKTTIKWRLDIISIEIKGKDVGFHQFKNISL